MKRTVTETILKNGEKRMWVANGCIDTGKLVFDETLTITPGNMTLWARGSTEGGCNNATCGSKVETLLLSIKTEEVQL